MKKRVTKRRKPALVSHHSTTGRRLPHSYTSYPLVLFILLVMGVFMGTLTFKAHAADVAINATVIGNPPTTPATIVTPSDGSHLSTQPITVNGTCGAGDVIKLFRNGSFSGSVICAGDGSFQIQTNLSVGSNDLQARTFNLADLEGPTSPVVNVTYTAPVPPAGGSSPVASTGSGGSGAPFVVGTGSTTTTGYYVGDTTTIQLIAQGGTAPYAFSVSWGDGTVTTAVREADGPFTLEHMYTSAGTGYGDSYAIKVTASDALGMSSFLELSIIIHAKNTVALALTPGITPKDQLPDLNLPLELKLIWPAYGIAVLMGGSFWLGEHHILLRPRPRIPLHKLKHS